MYQQLLCFFSMLLLPSVCLTPSFLHPKFPQELQITPNAVVCGKQPLSLLDNGYFIVVWSTEVEGSATSGIHGQIYSPNGAKYGAELIISTSTGYYQYNPVVSMQSNGSFLCIWESMGQDGDGYGVYGQFYSDFSTKLGSEFRVNTKTTGDQTNPSIDSVYGYFFVTWMGPDDSGAGVWGQIYDSLGNPIYNQEFSIPANSTGDQLHSYVSCMLGYSTYAKFIGFIITWETYLDGVHSVLAKFHHFDLKTKNLTVSQEIPMDAYGSKTTDSYPEVSVILADDSYLQVNQTVLISFVVTWQNQFYLGTQICYDIRVQIFNLWLNVLNVQAGKFNVFPFGASFVANTFFYSNHSYPSVELSKNYGFIVTWRNEKEDGDSGGIFGQIFTSAGNKKGNEFQINIMSKGDQRFPRTKMNEMGDVVTIWFSLNFNGMGISLNFQFYYQLITNVKFRNYKGEVSLRKLPTNRPIWAQVKIMEVEYSFITVWTDNYVFCEIFNTRQYVIGKVFSISMANSTDVFIDSFGDAVYFLIVWRNFYESNIYGQFIFINGTAKTNYSKINTDKAQVTRTCPAIKKLNNSDFVVTWIEKNLTSSVYSIQARFFSDINTAGPEVTINDQNYSAIDNLTLDGSLTEILVVWISPSNDSSHSQIFGSWWSIIGSALTFIKKTGDFLIYNSKNILQTYPSIGVNPFWPYLSIVTFADIWSADHGMDIFKQQIDNFGGVLGICSLVNAFTLLDQIQPSVVLMVNFIFIAWSSMMQDSDGYGIYAAAFDLMGNKIRNEVLINTEVVGDQTLPCIDADTIGNVLIAWYSSSSQTLKAQKLVIDYQADLSSLDTLGFELLQKFNTENSICSLLSDDGDYSLVAVSSGILQVVNLNFMYVITEIQASSSAEIVALTKSGIIVFVGLDDSSNNILLLNVSDWTNPVLLNETFPNLVWGNISNPLFFMEVTSSFLYLGYAYTIVILNITNPVNLTLISYWEPFGSIDTSNNFFSDIQKDQYIIMTVDQLNVISTINTENGIFRNISFFKNIVLTYTTFLPSNRIYLYVGTKSGLEIYSNNNFTYTLVSLVSLSRFIALIDMSQDGRFLSLTSSYGHYLFSLNNPSNPQLLNFLAVVNKISSSQLSANNEFMFLYAKSGTILQKIVTMHDQVTPFLVFSGYQLIPNVSTSYLLLSPKNEYVYGVTNNGIALAYTIINISDTVSSIPQAFNLGSDDPFYLHSFANTGLVIYKVTNDTTIQWLSNLDLVYQDYILRQDGKYIFVGSFETFTTLKVIDVSDKTKPQIVANLSLSPYKAYPNLTFADLNQTLIFMTIEQYGLLKINVTDPTKPTLIKFIKSPNIDLNLITRLTGDIYVITNFERIVLFDLSRDELFLLSETITSGNQIYGIATVNSTYLFALTSSNLTLIDLHDTANPIILDNIQLKSPLTSFPKLLTSEQNLCLYVSFVQIYCLFGTMQNYLYADLSINPNKEKIQFLISFWPVNLITGFSISLIKLSNINESLNWIRIDYPNLKLYIEPSSYLDLQSILQPLEVVYVTNIQSQELTAAELNFLKLASYVDNNNFITKEFNLSVPLTVDPSSGLSAEKMQFVLASHYNVRRYYFNTDSFLDLIPRVDIGYRVQDQIIAVTGGTITIDEQFNFYLFPNTTLSHYQTSLSFSASNLPAWLSFDSKNLRFFGTPTIANVDNYTMILSIFNGYHTTSDSFTLSVNYTPPEINPNMSLQKQMDAEPQVQMESQYFISKGCFIDPNPKPSLTYAATLDGQILPSWIQFDQSTLLLRITPNPENFQKQYTITITASNRHFSVSGYITFTVQTSWKYTLQLISQILGPLITILGLIRYRAALYNFFYRKRYTYEENKIFVDNYFEMEMYFIKDDLQMGGLFYENLKKRKKILTLLNLSLKNDEFKEALFTELISIRDDVNELNNIDLELLSKEGTLFIIVECFLYHKMLDMAKNKFTKETYLAMKKLIMQTKLNSWYQELVKVSYFIAFNRDLKNQKFPPVNVLEEDVERYLKLTLNNENLEQYTNLDVSLIYGMLKADALGIPPKPRGWFNKLEYCRGESVFINIFEIQEIKANRQTKKKTFLTNVFNNEKLPYWLKYKIKYGILTFYGTPPIHDQGTFDILIYQVSGVIVRSIILTSLPAIERIKTMFPIEKLRSQMIDFGPREMTLVVPPKKKSQVPKFIEENDEKMGLTYAITNANLLGTPLERRDPPPQSDKYLEYEEQVNVNSIK